MIFGIGTDLLRIDRVESVYERFGERFVNKILMPEEIEQFRRAKQPVRFLAMRFAAKEAIVKAMGTGFAHGMGIKDSGVKPNPLGRHDIIVSERGKKKCAELGVGSGFLTLTDEAGLIVAVAVLERA